MMTALCLTRPDLLALESPKDTRAGAVARMDGVLMTCNKESMTTEVAYIYEAKCRNFNAATLFGKYGGRAILGSVKLGNAQRASILFGVPTLLFMRLLDETFFLVKQITNGDGSFTFDYNEKWMRAKRPCQSGYEWAWQTFVPMTDAKKSPLEKEKPKSSTATLTYINGDYFRVCPKTGDILERVDEPEREEPEH